MRAKSGFSCKSKNNVNSLGWHQTQGIVAGCSNNAEHRADLLEPHGELSPCNAMRRCLLKPLL